MTFDVLTEDETIDRALAGASLARYGDGELRLATDGSAKSQRQRHPMLVEELRALLRGPTKSLVCIPSPRNAKPADWERYFSAKFTSLYGQQVYGSAFVTRSDSAPWINRPEYWDKIERLWKDHPICLVIGEEGGSLRVGDLVAAAKVRVVIGPAREAYAEIDRLEREVCNNRVPGERVIMCLGATATVLAERLARKGMHALDLGHIGRYMRKGNREVANAATASHITAVP